MFDDDGLDFDLLDSFSFELRQDYGEHRDRGAARGEGQGQQGRVEGAAAAAGGRPRRRWSESEVQAIIDDFKDPRGRYLRETGTSASTVVELNLMQLLDQVPRTERGRYGRRSRTTSEERDRRSRERNRLHSQATRTRKRFFDEITRIKNVLLAMQRARRQGLALPSTPTTTSTAVTPPSSSTGVSSNGKTELKQEHYAEHKQEEKHYAAFA